MWWWETSAWLTSSSNLTMRQLRNDLTKSSFVDTTDSDVLKWKILRHSKRKRKRKTLHGLLISISESVFFNIYSRHASIESPPSASVVLGDVRWSYEVIIHWHCAFINAEQSLEWPMPGVYRRLFLGRCGNRNKHMGQGQGVSNEAVGGHMPTSNLKSI